MQKRLLMTAVIALASIVFAGTARAALTSKIIHGNPLTVNVWSDGSFQIFNAAVPGHGQVYPTGNQAADMGVFANIDHKLYAPDFTNHGGTATGNLGTFLPWTTLSISEVTGSGTVGSPFRVIVSLKAPDNDVTVKLNVLYVQGQNFFRIQKQIKQTASHTIDVMLGADIYLGGSDSGVFLSVPELNAVGGEDCLTPPTYHILLIPVTDANESATGGYSDVWSMIAANHLIVNPPSGCVDNGAAIKWTDVTASDSIANIESAVSFGDIPSANAFISFGVHVTPSQIVALPGDTIGFSVVTQHNEESGFNSPLDLTVDDMPPGITVRLDSTHIAAPGDGTVTGTITIDPSVPFGSYNNLRILATGGGQSLAGLFSILLACDPPFILGVDQPRGVTVSPGRAAQLTVKATGSGPFTYQWFTGASGLVNFPLAGATSADFTTSALNDTTSYWVRITNPCGSTASQTVTVNVGSGAKPNRR